MDAGRDEPPRRAVDRDRALYAEVGEFLFAQDLDVTPLNFSLALEYVSRSDLAIEKAVDAALVEYGCLTNGIVEEIVAERDADKMTPETLETMLEKVEAHLAQVIGVTEGSRVSAQDYGTELKKQVDDLDRGQGVGAPAVDKLILLTRTMVETMRKAEAQMRASQKDTRALQRNLEAARRAAEQDYLTGLPNRRAFEAVLKTREKVAREQGTPLAIVFCDLDHFKAINDTYGHDTGDRVLQFVANLFAQISRNACHVARHGGEEFAMLLDASADEAAQIIDDARDDLANRKLVNRDDGERLAPVSFSAGIAEVLAYADGRAALKAADEALYRAKQDGRNRVYIAAAARQEAA
ncbi:GGDEF domain-containing protein [Sphingosinicella sp. LHD-64]|uniref:GGDEF domain-containing protein n=1 Tax=Sphingosinicella sp. LHD-64 TaxID=3072139 RepID=UPI00280E0EAD|nr:GGDEF domain-containing protein [Sphingosinicella sp. LHD-64]MDQ8754932.1 GGDEF domain-containing protein [Sphingosinicella sp. LHD-64]